VLGVERGSRDFTAPVHAMFPAEQSQPAAAVTAHAAASVGETRT
jgi:hypothetical protein